jgi:hypothetical protein
MSLKEQVRALLHRAAGFQHPETEPKDLAVILWDLTEQDEAQKHSVEPGYYFTVGPMTEKIASDEDLMYELIPYFFQTLFEEDLVGKSDIAIPIDNEGKYAVDPATSWKFTVIGLTNNSLLLVHAEQVRPDEAQQALTSSIQEDQGTISFRPRESDT